MNYLFKNAWVIFFWGVSNGQFDSLLSVPISSQLPYEVEQDSVVCMYVCIHSLGMNLLAGSIP